MTMDVVITTAAEADLRAIAIFLAEHSPRGFMQTVDELYDAMYGIAEFPERFSLVPGHADSGIRRRVHGSYLIFYRIKPPRVDILHVLHGATDYEKIIFPNDHFQ